MQQLQREVMELRKKNEESLKAAIAGTGKALPELQSEAGLGSTGGWTNTFKSKHSRLRSVGMEVAFKVDQLLNCLETA